MTMKTAIWGLAQRNRTGSRLLALRSLARDSQLRRSGWFDSFFRSMPVDASGKPIPWLTYASLRFLTDRLHTGMSIFEYGSGNSTLWWSEHVAHVTSCEHDRDWFNLMRGRLPPTVEYIYAETTGDDYARKIGTQGERFDVVVIDGRNRVQCAKTSVVALKKDGVILWDDSDRAQYQEGYAFLSEQGFRRLDFWGMGPALLQEWCTSIFYRTSNCLGI